MNRHIKKVAVLGSGVMGSCVICHFAHVWIQVLLFCMIQTGFAQTSSTIIKTDPIHNLLGNPNLILEKKLSDKFYLKTAALFRTHDFEPEGGEYNIPSSQKSRGFRLGLGLSKFLSKDTFATGFYHSFIFRYGFTKIYNLEQRGFNGTPYTIIDVNRHYFEQCYVIGYQFTLSKTYPVSKNIILDVYIGPGLRQHFNKVTGTKPTDFVIYYGLTNQEDLEIKEGFSVMIRPFMGINIGYLIN